MRTIGIPASDSTPKVASAQNSTEALDEATEESTSSGLSGPRRNGPGAATGPEIISGAEPKPYHLNGYAAVFVPGTAPSTAPLNPVLSSAPSALTAPTTLPTARATRAVRPKRSARAVSSTRITVNGERKACKYFARGRCRYGDACEDLHDLDAQFSNPGGRRAVASAMAQTDSSGYNRRSRTLVHPRPDSIGLTAAPPTVSSAASQASAPKRVKLQSSTREAESTVDPLKTSLPSHGTRRTKGLIAMQEPRERMDTACAFSVEAGSGTHAASPTATYEVSPFEWRWGQSTSGVSSGTTHFNDAKTRLKRKPIRNKDHNGLIE